jgi:hypothetical protein
MPASPAAYRRFALCAIVLCALALPARAETVVVECKISHRTVNGAGTSYSDTERDQPELRERFAFNVSKGRGCIMAGDACDAKLGRLSAEQDESTVTVRGADPPVMLAYGFTRKAFYLLVGDDTSYSERGDCREIQLDVVMP